MTTYTTGIPRMRRNIQPPPIPVVKLTVNKTITGYPLDNTQFFLRITLPSGFTLTGIPFSQSVPFVMESLQYGTYTIEEEVLANYLQVSITPSTFTLSAENPQQTVEIVNLLNLGTVTVTKLITGVTEDETYFDVVITGQGLDPIEQSGQVRLDEPLIFYDLPLDDYVITELPIDGYTLTSITPSSVTIEEDGLNKGVVIVNEKEGGELALELTFDDIDNVPVADASSLSDWNTFFDLPTYGTAFSSVEVVGNLVKLYGGSEITVKESLFLYSFLTEVNDKSNSINVLGNTCFGGCGILSKVTFPILTTAGNQSLGSCSLLVEVNAPNLISIDFGCFSTCLILSNINLPNLSVVGDSAFFLCSILSDITLPLLENLGTTTGSSNVFSGITGQTITLTIPAALMTCNGGLPDGDIQYLQANNTVTIITV